VFYQQCVAVGWRLRDHAGPAVAARAGVVLTVTGWPHSSESFGAIARASRSGPPPAPNGSIIRTGLLDSLVWTRPRLLRFSRVRMCFNIPNEKKQEQTWPGPHKTIQPSRCV